MYTLVRTSPAGITYTLSTTTQVERATAPSVGFFGQALVRLKHGTFAVRTSDRNTCRLVTEHDYGVEFDGEYRLEGATVSTGSYKLRADMAGSDVLLGTHNVVLWELEDVGLWIESGSASIDQLLESLESLVPIKKNDTVVLSGAKPSQYNAHAYNLLLTLYGRGALDLWPRSLRTAKSQGHPATSGYMYRSSDPNNQFLTLRTGTAHAELHLIEEELDAAVNFLQNQVLSLTSRR